MSAAAIEAPLQRAAAALASARRVLVTGHEKPDGDALGSSLGVGIIAERLGADVLFFNVDPPPFNFEFLPRADRLVSELPDGWVPDVTVILDCSQRHRVGDRFPKAGWGETVICLDHHRTHDPDVADIFVHDEAAAATGELVLKLADAANVALDRELAMPIYCALMTDTGSFRYSSTRPETLQMAARLLAAGVDSWEMASAVYESEPIERLRLMRLVLETLEVSESGKLATIVITDSMFAASGADVTMTDGLINLARSVRGVEVAAQLTEQDDGTFRVGLRSRGHVDVGRVAEHFGGGGHRNAAGFSSNAALATLREELETALGAVLATG